MTELIVFDWDGTLMDSEARIVACLRQAAREEGWPVPDAARARSVIGLGLRQALATLFPAASGVAVERLAAAYRRHFFSDSLAPSRLFPGVRALLEQLRLAGFQLAIATGKSRRGLERELARTGLGAAFVASRCADESRSKPDPRMLLEILEETGQAPARALVVGDTEFDMQMAMAAGVPAVGVAHGVHPPERLRRAGALTVFERLEMLPDWLASRARLSP